LEVPEKIIARFFTAICILYSYSSFRFLNGLAGTPATI